MALTGMANRYHGMLAQRAERERPRKAVWSPPTAPAARTAADAPAVDASAIAAADAVFAFTAARRVIHDVLIELPEDPGQLEVAQIERLRQLSRSAVAEHTLGPATYERVRAAYRQWRAGEASSEESISVALGARAAELTALDLGLYEELDL